MASTTAELPPKVSFWRRSWFSLRLRRAYRADLYRPDILLGLTGMILAIAGLVWTLSPPSLRQAYAPPTWPVWLISFIALVVLVPLFSGWFILWTANPETYARISLAGRPIREVLFLIASDARKACKAVLTTTKTHAINSLQREPGSLAQDFQSRAAVVCDRLRTRNKRQEWRLRRIEALKQRAADDFQIPIRRFCDHVLQYSPLMQRDRTRNHLDDWKTLAGGNTSPPAKERAALRIALLAENTLRRIRYLEELMAFRDLHDYIHSFSASNSSSGALQTYARALQHVASRQWRPKGIRSYLLRWSEKQANHRLAFLFRKQRAHPGFSLHAQLVSALAGFEKQRSLWLWRMLPFQHSDDKLHKYLREAVARIDSERYPGLQSKHLKALEKLPDYLTRKIWRQRCKAVAHFVQWFEGNYASIREDGPPLYLVSHGYSVNVLAALLALEGCLPQCPRSSTTVGRRPWLSSGCVRVFFYLEPQEDEFDTRLMEYDIRKSVLLTQRLRQSGERKRDSRVARHWAAGDHHVLLNLLNPGDRVLILLGAEVFDEQHRVVHPRGMPLTKFIKELRSSIGAAGIEVAVIAEEYKCKRSLVDEIQFYDQHFDRLAVYPQDTVETIFTENGLRSREVAWKGAEKGSVH